LKNFNLSRSFRSDIKPQFDFYSASVGDVVAVSVRYIAGNGRNLKRGYYVELTAKTIQPDGMISWMPFSAPRSSVLLLEAARYSSAVLSRFAALFDAMVPELAAAWLVDRAAVELQIVSTVFEA
jgi:hypothetical protein